MNAGNLFSVMNVSWATQLGSEVCDLAANWRAMRCLGRLRYAAAAAGLTITLMMAAPPHLSAQTAGTESGQELNAGAVPEPKMIPAQDVPRGEEIPVSGVRFDQGGYMVDEKSGDTIDVPFTDHNLNVIRFARSTNGTSYYVNEGEAPVLYIPVGFFLESSVNGLARWQPLPADFAEVRPMYVSMAPSWEEYVHLNFYSEMRWYGGVWGYHAGSRIIMPGTSIIIGAQRFNYAGYIGYARYRPGVILGARVHEPIRRIVGRERGLPLHRDLDRSGHPGSVLRETGHGLEPPRPDAHRFNHLDAAAHGFESSRLGEHRLNHLDAAARTHEEISQAEHRTPLTETNRALDRGSVLHSDHPASHQAVGERVSGGAAAQSHTGAGRTTSALAGVTTPAPASHPSSSAKGSSSKPAKK